MVPSSPPRTTDQQPPQPSPPPRQMSNVAHPATEREHRSSGASEAHKSSRARRASSPPPATNRPSRLRESISRFDSSKSSFPSIAQSSTRQSTTSNRHSSADDSAGTERKQQPKEQKKRRTRPPNLAGPRLSQRITAIPDNLSVETPGSGSSQRGAGGSYYTSSDSVGGGGEEPKEGGRSGAGGGGKALFAMGGVFPKHAPRRRRSTMAKEWQEQEEDRRGRGSKWRAELPHGGGDDYASSAALDTGSSAEDAPSTAGSSARRGSSANVGERGDPFEDLDRGRSSSRPLEVVVSRDEEREHADEIAESLREEVGRSGDEADMEDRPRLTKKSHSGSSNMIAEEKGDDKHDDGERKGDRWHEDDLGEEQDVENEERTRPKDGGEQPALGGELNQDKEDWQHDLDHDENDPQIRNWWGTIRYTLREPLAEFLGTLVLVVIGVGSDCQTKISENSMGAYQSMNWAWGFGVMASIYIAGGISGGHTNPSVTLVLALFRGFPWKLVPRYILAQVAGAFCGALIIYGNYSRAIGEYDGEKTIVATATANASAPLFITLPAKQVGGTVEGFCQEILASGILTVAVLALGDENNAPPGAGLGAIVLGFVVVAIGMSNGWISGYAINSARDLGPRLALWVLGYGIKLWHHDDWWWLTGAICGPIVGSIAGALAYDICIFTGPGSPVNYSGREIVEASGLPRMHNMVRMAVDPRYRRRRLSASRTQDPEQLAETGMVPASLQRQRSRKNVPPGRMAPDEIDEMAAVSRRWRRGRAKVSRQEEQSRQREAHEKAEWRRSVEELKQRERERTDPASEERERERERTDPASEEREREREKKELRKTNLHRLSRALLAVGSLSRSYKLVESSHTHLDNLHQHFSLNMAIHSLEDASTATYPPQNSLQAALNNRAAMDSLATVQLDEQAAGQGQGGQADGAQCNCPNQAEHEAMRLRGGCFNLGLCGCVSDSAPATTGFAVSSVQ
ncbi:hypothetical protein JCM11251_005188 [Rhodosporidiobolus azoricus]